MQHSNPTAKKPVRFRAFPAACGYPFATVVKLLGGLYNGREQTCAPVSFQGNIDKRPLLLASEAGAAKGILPVWWNKIA
jgi:hypothetical protein